MNPQSINTLKVSFGVKSGNTKTKTIRKPTGKQLIKAIDKALKNKTISNQNASCTIGAWGEDFPHLYLKLNLPDQLLVEVIAAMHEEYDDYGKIESDDGGYQRTMVVRYDKLLRIEADKPMLPTRYVEASDIKDIGLLDKHLKSIFKEVYIQQGEDGYGSFDSYIDFRKLYQK